MTEKYLLANGVRLAYDDFGDHTNPAIVLIMGLGTQMIAWPEVFCERLAAEGYWVIRYDNRDIGLSQKMDSSGSPNLAKMIIFSKIGLPVKVPYSLKICRRTPLACWMRWKSTKRISLASRWEA